MAKPKKLSQRTARQSTQRKHAVGILLVIDNEPIRQEAYGQYLALEREAAQIRTQIEQFENVERPAYEQWEALHFGPALSEIRQTGDVLREKNQLIDEIEDEVHWSRCSYVVAYRRVLKRRSEPETENPEPADPRSRSDDEDDSGMGVGDKLFGARDLPPDFNIQDFDRAPKAEQRKFRTFFEQIASLYHLMTGRPTPILDEILAAERIRINPEKHLLPSDRSEAAEPNPDARLKTLYRKIVRQLHPDSNGEFTLHERELWDIAQAAYRDHDLNGLEAVAARIELGTGGEASAQTSLGLLRRIIDDLRKALNTIRHQLDTARRQPSWRFSKINARQLAKLATKRRLQIDRELTDHRLSLKEITHFLDDLAHKAAQPPKARKKKSPATPVKPKARETQDFQQDFTW